MRRRSQLRYIVTGPGTPEPPLSYEEEGQALSRATTYAERSVDVLGTWYVRDAISGDIVGYAERLERVTITVRNEQRKVRQVK